MSIQNNTSCCVCYNKTNSTTNTLCENKHTDNICQSCCNILTDCPLCLDERKYLYRNLSFKIDAEPSLIERLYNKPNFQFRQALSNTFPYLTKFQNDYKFTHGKYGQKWLSDINDKQYLQWFLSNTKLSNKNSNLFLDKINSL